MKAGETRYGYCRCGCGGKTTISKCSNKTRGDVKGEPKKYIKGHRSKNNAPDYKVDKNGCWVWQKQINNKGYGIAYKKGSGMTYAHRVYYERHRGPIPENMVIDHLCRNTACVNPDHMEVVTQTENIQRGSRAILNPEMVAHIRRDYGNGKKISEIAKKYGIPYMTVSASARRMTWKNLP